MDIEVVEHTINMNVEHNISMNVELNINMNVEHEYKSEC